MAEDTEQSILLRKILVAIDTSGHSRAALEAAATLARITEAQVHGLFVQEEQWNCIGQLPSLSAINELTGHSQALEEGSIEQQVELLKQRLHRQLRTVSRQHQINHSWQTARGKVAEEILEAAKEADLITIGRRGRSFMRKSNLGSTARAIIRKADKPVLILKKGLELGQTITVVYNASAESQKGLRLALSIAQKNESKLWILVMDENSGGSEQRDKTVEQMVEDASVPVNVTIFQKPNVGQFLNVVNYQQSGMLVIPKNQSFLQGDALEITIEHIQCPVLLIT
jgi:nucleotide-binding universal stress UspA family protein